MSGSFQDFSSNSIIQSELASISQGRLTLTSNTPVLSGNVTGATNIYYTPYKGNQISIYNGNSWEVKSFSELTLSLSGLTADTIYDVFVYDNNGTLTLESVAWNNSGAGTSARATALSWLDGVRVKSSDNRKYLGSFICNSSGGQIDFISGVENTPASNGFFNEYNKEHLILKISDDTGHTYTTDGWRVWRANNNNVIKIISPSSSIGVQYRAYMDYTGNAIVSLNTLRQSISQQTFFVNNGSYFNVSADILVTVTGYNEIHLEQYGYAVNTGYDNMRLEVSIQY